MAAAAAAAAAADEEGIAEVGWKMPAQWTDGAWRASSLLPRRLARLSRGVPIAGSLCSAAGVALRRGGGAAPAAEPGHPDL